jgi:hypothetical protein
VIVPKQKEQKKINKEKQMSVCIKRASRREDLEPKLRKKGWTVQLHDEHYMGSRRFFKTWWEREDDVLIFVTHRPTNTIKCDGKIKNWKRIYERKEKENNGIR